MSDPALVLRARRLLGLARTAGLDRDEAARRAGDLIARLGLAHASQVPLQALSRGNAQRALVAQALLADPDLLVLDEPSGGLDDNGVARVVAEIQRAADRQAVVLVARHPTAPLPLPPGVTWRLRDSGVETMPRSGDDGPGQAVLPGTMEVETGDGAVQRVPEAGLPAVLRAALDAGLTIPAGSCPIPVSARPDSLVAGWTARFVPQLADFRGGARYDGGSPARIRRRARAGRFPGDRFPSSGSPLRALSSCFRWRRRHPDPGHGVHRQGRRWQEQEG